MTDADGDRSDYYRAEIRSLRADLAREERAYRRITALATVLAVASVAVFLLLVSQGIPHDRARPHHPRHPRRPRAGAMPVRGRVVERVVRIEPEGLSSTTELAGVAYALGRHAERRDFVRLVEELDLFVASVLERVFSDAHIALWEEYAGGERPATEGEEPVGVHLTVMLGDQEEVMVQVPGLALSSEYNDFEQNRALAKGLRALADELDSMADKEEQREAHPDPAEALSDEARMDAALRGEARLMRHLHGED